MEYLNQLNTNLIGIISIIGPQKSEKSYFANLILGEKIVFDSTKETSGIYMYGQPIAQGENTDLLVLDTEGLYKPINSGTNYDKQSFILSCLTSSILVYNTDETIQDCINKFTNLAKESLSCIKKIEGKDLTSTDMPLVYFILHNNNIDSNTANQQFRNLVKDNPIFSIFFQNYKICVLKNAGDINITKDKNKKYQGIKIEEVGSLDDQDYKQKAKLIKDQIMNDLEPKKINNCNIDGKCLFGIIQSFVDSLNKNEDIILRKLNLKKHSSNGFMQIYRNNNAHIDTKYLQYNKIIKNKTIKNENPFSIDSKYNSKIDECGRAQDEYSRYGRCRLHRQPYLCGTA